jgi:hypothetical protein
VPSLPQFAERQATTQEQAEEDRVVWEKEEPVEAVLVEVPDAV